MRGSHRTTVVDCIVLVACVALAALTLGAVGESGRRRAKELVCQSNLRQWGKFFQSYIEKNDGDFYTGCTRDGYWWPLQLPTAQQNWKTNRTWFCPMATQPTYSETGEVVRESSSLNAWGIYASPGAMTYGGQTYTMNPSGLSGSYALNGYMLDISDNALHRGSIPATESWRDFDNVAEASNVPVFIEALRFDLWPGYTDTPPASESAAWSQNHMARCCIDRHDGAVNCLFLDGAVRKVGLKELWTLKWHRSFNTAGPWTRAGGVLPTDWPQWMRGFKDY